MLIDVAPGQVLGRYELLLPVAKGGMAMVWAARLKGSRGFQKLVAIKTMLPLMGDDPNFERMFLDEASLASEVRHPHVIEILDLGEQDNVLYLVMEWVEGEALNVLMKYASKRGGVPLPMAAALIAQACRGIHAAHELRDDRGVLVGLVHRDVTPHNILVTYDGVVKVVDFGVAKATSRVAAETEAGQIKGKIAYMSPEQLRGDPIDRRTDVFALGILLYMLTTGTHPFKGDGEQQTVKFITSDQPAPSPRVLQPHYSRELEAVVLQALAKDPGKRYPSANDLLKELTRVVPLATDEELAEYVRNLLQERMEKRRRAVRAALELADQGNRARSEAPTLVEAESQDDVATRVDAVGVDGGRRSLDSMAEIDSTPGIPALDQDSSSSAGVAHLSAPDFRSRRSSVTLPLALVGMAAAAGVSFWLARGSGEDAEVHASEREVAAPRISGASPPTESVAATEGIEDHPAGTAEGTEPSSDADASSLDETSSSLEQEEPTDADGAASAEPPPRVPPNDSKRPSRTSTHRPSTPATTTSSRSRAFVTPVRDPGF